jgi:hypothetical protein
MLALAGCVQVPVSGQWDFGTKKAPVYGNERIGQDFYVSDRNLTRIDVSLYPSRLLKSGQAMRDRRAALRRLKGQSLTMSLYSLPDKERLVSRALPAGRIKATRMYSFTFKPIAGSKQRRYYFELKSPGLTRESAVAVRITGADRYKEGAAFINDERRADADLGFQTYINMTSIILAHSVASRLAADPAFMALWGLMVLSVLVAAILARRRERLVT